MVSFYLGKTERKDIKLVSRLDFFMFDHGAGVVISDHWPDPSDKC
jgi:hypothetical protein